MKEERVDYENKLEDAWTLDVIRKKNINKDLLDKVIQFLKTDGFEKDFNDTISRYNTVKEYLKKWTKNNNLMLKIMGKERDSYKLTQLYILLATAHFLKLNISAEEQAFAIEDKMWENRRALFSAFKDTADYFSEESLYYLLLVEALKQAGFNGYIKDKKLHELGVKLLKEGEKLFEFHIEHYNTDLDNGFKFVIDY